MQQPQPPSSIHATCAHIFAEQRKSNHTRWLLSSAQLAPESLDQRNQRARNRLADSRTGRITMQWRHCRGARSRAKQTRFGQRMKYLSQMMIINYAVILATSPAGARPLVMTTAEGALSIGEKVPNRSLRLAASPTAPSSTPAGSAQRSDHHRARTSSRSSPPGAQPRRCLRGARPGTRRRRRVPTGLRRHPASGRRCRSWCVHPREPSRAPRYRKSSGSHVGGHLGHPSYPAASTGPARAAARAGPTPHRPRRTGVATSSTTSSSSIRQSPRTDRIRAAISAACRHAASGPDTTAAAAPTAARSAAA